jgi:hypothetical protein
MKRKLLIVIMPMLLIGLMLMNTTPALGAGSLSGVSSARVGITYTVTASDLDSTKMYTVEAAHSGGNLTEVITGSSSGTVAFTFDSEDADGKVPIQLWQVFVNLTHSATVEDTLLINLDAPDQGLSTAFFVGILGGLLVIVIIVRVVRNLINST